MGTLGHVRGGRLSVELELAAALAPGGLDRVLDGLSEIVFHQAAGKRQCDCVKSSVFTMSRTPPRQLEIGHQGTYLSSLRLVLVSRAFPSAMPVCSPRLLYRRLQDGGITVLDESQHSICLGPSLDN